MSHWALIWDRKFNCIWYWCFHQTLQPTFFSWCRIGSWFDAEILSKACKLHSVLVSHWASISYWNSDWNLEPTLCAGVAVDLALILLVWPNSGGYALRCCCTGSWFDLDGSAKQGTFTLRWCRIGLWIDIEIPTETCNWYCVLVLHRALIRYWKFNQHLDPILCAGVASGLDSILQLQLKPGTYALRWCRIGSWLLSWYWIVH